MKILGIDPGQQTGLAIYQGGKLTQLETVAPYQIANHIKSHWPDRVIFEDSRLTSPIFARGVSRLAMLKIARNVGMVDMVCHMIVDACDRMGIPAHGISPKDKGAKLDAEKFNRETHWTDKSNQHTRDAAMVAFRFRNLSK